MKTRMILLICCLFLISAIGLKVSFVSASNSQDDVEINIKEINYRGGNIYDITIEVLFHDMKLYNDNVLLSYHIYDMNSKEVIVFENERLPINLDNGKTLIDYTIKVDESIKDCIITFDLVDQDNSYWFSLNDKIKMKTFDIKHSYNSIKSNLAILKNEILDHPYIFIINVLVCISALSAAIYIKKKEIL